MARILGIDPGSRSTGYGLIDTAGGGLKFIHCGCIRSVSTDSQPARLKRILDGLCEVIEAHRPGEAALEEVFMGRNAAAALKLGQARGGALAACLLHDLPIGEYPARRVKQAVVGGGSADKQQVRYMVARLLGLSLTEVNISEDAADALAVAICHANTRLGLQRMAAAKTGSAR